MAADLGRDQACLAVERLGGEVAELLDVVERVAGGDRNAVVSAVAGVHDVVAALIEGSADDDRQLLRPGLLQAQHVWLGAIEESLDPRQPAPEVS